MLGAPTGLVLVAILAVATWHDLRSRLVPNWLSGALLCLFVLDGALRLDAGGLLDGLAASGLVLACGYLLWSFRLLGAGDVKLLAATACFAGLTGLPAFLVAVGAAGGLLAILVLVARHPMAVLARSGAVALAFGSLAPRLDGTLGVRTIIHDSGDRPSLPYAAAIAAGGLWALAAGPWF